MTRLAAAELAEFWALGLAVEADHVPDDDWQRALREARVQEAYCASSMGTAETGWVRVTSPQARRDNCAVVPPGQIAEDTDRANLRDDRDVIGVCWVGFWDQQRRNALSQLPADKHDAFLEECARMLVELERSWKHDRDNPNRLLLVDWLISANRLERLDAELAAIKSSALAHLVRGVRARWLTRDVGAAFDAVLASAARGAPHYYKHGNVEHKRVLRMQLVRCIVRLARRST